MSYIGPIDKYNLDRLRELDLVLYRSQTVPRGSYRYLIDTLIGEWEQRGKRIVELEAALAQFADHEDAASVLNRHWTNNAWYPGHPTLTGEDES